MDKRLKASQTPAVREALLKKQMHRCPICQGSLRSTATKSPALDHDHKTGFIRDVLCINCNGIEGRVFSLARRARHTLTELQWLTNLVTYLTHHETPQHGGILHHTHKTPEELRLERNKKARLKRAAAKK